MRTHRHAIEVFHLLFLRAFVQRVDKTLFALKGGCNLRFFLKSIRYSEDMDLDIRTMAVGTLRKNVDTVLEAQSFVQTLRAQQLEITSASPSKHTDTTQRWKLSLRLTDSGAALPTKIEFSRRALATHAVLEPVDPDVIRAYRLYPVIVQHYSAGEAFAQKILALALRAQVQSRDVFDLKLLLDAGAGKRPLPEKAAAQLPAAVANAMTVDYDAFAGEVLAYLEPDYQEHYQNPKVWNELQQQVVDALEALSP